MAKETDMDKQIEQLRSSWENEEFQKKHAEARNLVMRTLRELNGFYNCKDRIWVYTLCRKPYEDTREHLWQITA